MQKELGSPEDSLFNYFLNKNIGFKELSENSHHPESSRQADSLPSLPTTLPNTPQQFPTSRPASLIQRSVLPNLQLRGTVSPDNSQSISLSHPGSPPLLRRSKRFRKQNIKLDDYILAVVLEDFDICFAVRLPNYTIDDIKLEQALAHLGCQKSMRSEVNSLKINDTWKLVELPTRKKVIYGRWIFKIKPSLDGTAPNLKLRWIVKGFDFNETFFLVVKWTTVRILTTFATHKNWSFTT
jgi:hypothetical protein